MSTSDETGEVFAEYESFLTPPTLYYLPSGGTEPRQVTAQQPTFDGSRFAVQQLWAVSADGTRIPYFVVGAKDLTPDGSHPVWMSGTAASRTRSPRRTPDRTRTCAGSTASSGWSAAGCSCCRTSAVEASSGRRGTRRR